MPIIWGPGLTIVLRSLPSLVLSPILIATLPTVLARALPPSASPDAVQAFLALPAPVRALLSLVTYAVIQHAAGKLNRRRDRKRLGPDVVDVPAVKFRLPGNVGYIPYVIQNRAIDYCGGHWPAFLEQYGNTFDIRLLGGDVIFTTEPEHMKMILSTQFTSFEKGKGFKNKVFSVLGTGIFNSDGDMWKFHRNISRPYFTRDRISHFDLFARHSDSAINKLLARLSEPPKPGQPSAVDFQDLVARFTLDSGTEFLFGRDVHSLDAPLPYPKESPMDDSASFAAAFGRAQELLVLRASWVYFWPWIEMFWDRTAKDMKVIDAYVRPILKEKLEEKRKRGAKMKVVGVSEKEGEKGKMLEEGGDTLLDHLVQFTDDETVIKDEIVNILVAGRDTTATTLTFAVYLLATNPDVMHKLRQEVFEHVGSSNYPTSDNFREMKYLRAVINETLRLFPAVPANERTAVKSTVFRSGGKAFYIPAGANISYSVLYMHRRKDLWGPDADIFDPERWIDERLKKYLTPNPFIFLPFNAGPRICLGQQFAYNESSFFLVRLLQRVESIELVPEAHPEGTLPPKEWKEGLGRKAYEQVWPKSHLTMYCNGGLWVRMKEAGPIAE
ncbi:CYP63 cytochrome P450 monooxygenase-like protein [Ceratobasidium sp. AG-I]|nr:CYP63 cytochrome P450 monooxygenase-like protein [Ceratobasidium sp. AG-I]